MRKKLIIKRIMSFGLAGMLFLSGCAGNEAVESTEQQTVQNTASKEFDLYLEEVFLEEVVQNTIDLHYTLAKPENYGITEYDVTLGEFSLADMQQALEEMKEFKKELEEFDREELSREQKLTYEILLNNIDVELAAKDLLLYTEFLSPLTGYQAQLPVILAEYGFRTKQDIEDYLKLVSQMDDLFADVLAFEREKSAAGLFMPDYAVDAVLDQCEQFVENPEENYMIEVFEDQMADFEGITAQEREAYCAQNEEIITTEVVKGYELLIDGLTELKGTGTNDKGLCYYDKGREYYEYLIRTNVGSDLTVEEMQEKTEQYIMSCMRNISMNLEQRPDVAEKLTDYEFPITEPTEILADLTEKMLDDFPKPPDVNYTVKKVHPSMEEYSSPAFYLSTPIDDYTNNTIYINESYLGENAQMDLYPMLAHEGYPGHLYQNAYTASSGIAPIRHLFSCSGYSEGWATYVENYSYSISGLDSVLADVLAWNSSASLGIYAYADMGIHYDGWDREDLSEFLSGFGLGDEEIVNEMYEAMVEEPANYLNYFIGYLEILDLRDEMKEKMGKDFTLKKFHEEFLAAGPAPFYILDDYLLD